jgi:Regulator of chromosome condensation (RCC1) repeat
MLSPVRWVVLHAPRSPLPHAHRCDCNDAAPPPAARVPLACQPASQAWHQPTSDASRPPSFFAAPGAQRYITWPVRAGDNRVGQLGVLPRGAVFAPQPIKGAVRWASVALSAKHSIAIASDGKVYCWGLNDQGQLGRGVINQECSDPEPVRASFQFPCMRALGRDGATGLRAGVRQSARAVRSASGE